MGGGQPMKVTDIEVLVLRQPQINYIEDSTQDACVVRVHTDAGVTGIGDTDSAPMAVKACIEMPSSHNQCRGLKEILVGENPLDVEGCWEKMYRYSSWYGRRGVAVHAIGALDLALWDIKGQVEEKPLWALWGGKRHDRIRAYASVLMPDTSDEAAREAALWAERGFTAVKLGWGGFRLGLEKSVALVRAARRAIGDELDLLLDVGFIEIRTAQEAIRWVKALEEFRPYWIEEILPPDDVEGYRVLSDGVETPIATGENNATVREFEDLLRRGGVDIIQPDVTRCGGLTEARRIGLLAHEFGRPCVPHAWRNGIVISASLHVNAILPNSLFQEFCQANTPLNHELVREQFPIRTGYLDVPDAPGLGVHLNEEILHRYLVA
jgi:L-rhamnonate dehydratase